MPTAPPVPSELLSLIVGPVGALVIAVLVIAGLLRLCQLLWREHLKADADDRVQRDQAYRLLEAEQQNSRDQVAAWNRRTELDAARGRRDDQ